MRLIKPSVELITQLHPFKKVEQIGRICYKSESATTDNSYNKFVTNLISAKHFAMLEHSRVTFIISQESKSISQLISKLINIPGVIALPYHKQDNSIILSVSLSHLYNPKWKQVSVLFNMLRNIINTQYKLTIPTDTSSLNIDYSGYSIELVDVEDLVNLSVTNYNQVKFVTLKFICDRGVSHELVRHRCAVAQESTRYCDYTKSKFGQDISFIEPANFESWTTSVRYMYMKCLSECEDTYKYMIGEGMKPQQARAVLPNSLKTEVVLTMSIDSWQHFLDLRSRGTTGAPHPDMKVVADLAAAFI